MPPSPAALGAEQDLLFGVLAVQLSFATPRQVMRAAAVCAADPSQDLPARLEADGVVTAARRKMLEAMLVEACAHHDGDTRETLATLGGEDLVLQSFGDAPDGLAATLGAEDAQGAAGPAPDPALAATMGAEPGQDAGLDATMAPGEDDRAPTFDEDGERVTQEQPGHYTLRDLETGEPTPSKEAAELGRGAIGRVLAAFDEHLGREVAVKELLTGVVGPVSSKITGQTPASQTQAMVARFLREGRVTGQLEHPNVVPVYELGRRPTGVLYYTMKRVRGRTLEDALAECHSTSDRLRLLGHFVGLCNGVAYAHSRGVIHRDIKPANVMVGEFGETLVLDWGLAKVRGKRDIRGAEIQREIELMHDAGAAGETVSGRVMGTPAYMSPEQADGRVDDIDERSDVWCLGAVLYELLTGRHPYTGTSVYEVLGKVLAGPPQPVREVNENAPPDLAAVAGKALAWDPKDRYQRARELAEEVEAYQSGEKVEAYEYSTWELLRRFVGRAKAALVVATAALVLLAVLGVAAWDNVLEERDRAREAEKESRGNLAEALAERARSAVTAGDRMGAELFAAAALDLTERPDARGTLLQLAGGWRPRLVWDVLRGKPCDALAFAPDGSRLACGTLQSAVLYDATEGGELDHLPMSGQWLRGLAYSPDGATLAAASNDRLVHLWPLGSGTRRRLEGHRDKVWAVAFSRDGARAVSAAEDGDVRVWDVESGAVLRTVSGHGGLARAVALAPGLVASAGDGGVVRLWAPEGEAEPRDLPTGEEWIGALALTKDGKWLATGGKGGVVRLWEVTTGREVGRLAGHKGYVAALAFSVDDRWLASGGLDGAVRLWDPRAGRELVRLIGLSGEVKAVAFSPDGNRLAASGADNGLRVWQVGFEAGPMRSPSDRGPIERLVYAPGGDALAADHESGIWLSNLASGASQQLKGGEDGVDFSGDGAFLAWGAGKTVALLDLASGAARRELAGHDAPVRAVALSPDGSRAASGDKRGRLRLWDVASGEPGPGPSGHKKAVTSLAFSPDGKLLASGSEDETVRVWDVTAGKTRATLTGHDAVVTAVAFVRVGRRTLVVSSGKDEAVRVWDPERGRELEPRLEHDLWVYSLATSADGRLLASGSADRAVRLWDLGEKSRREVARLTDHDGWVTALAFSPDGSTLAVGTQAGTLQRWSLAVLPTPGPELLKRAQRDFGLGLDGLKPIPLREAEKTAAVSAARGR